MDEPKNTKKAASVVIHTPSGLLTLLRTKWLSEGTPLQLPGGGCEPDENAWRCARRELAEETALRLNPDMFKYFGSHKTKWCSELSFYEVQLSYRPQLVLDNTKFFGYIWLPHKNTNNLKLFDSIMMPGLKWYLNKKGFLSN